ncbi:hypothetical protein H1C71_013967 [Ictidomys tridecemlineatus]|nr:hypothetical protein H1C71_013967 [Ictidomys tridecemlineatus]
MVQKVTKTKGLWATLPGIWGAQFTLQWCNGLQPPVALLDLMLLLFLPSRHGRFAWANTAASPRCTTLPRVSTLGRHHLILCPSFPPDQLLVCGHINELSGWPHRPHQAGPQSLKCFPPPVLEAAGP